MTPFEQESQDAKHSYFSHHLGRKCAHPPPRTGGGGHFDGATNAYISVCSKKLNPTKVGLNFLAERIGLDSPSRPGAGGDTPLHP